MRDTYPCSVCGTTLVGITAVIQMIYIGKDDDPACPTASGIKQGFYRVFNGGIEFYSCLYDLGNMAPGYSNSPPGNGRNDIDNHGEVPGYDEVSSSPEQPSLHILIYIEPVVGRVFEIPIEMDQNGGRDQNSGQESGPKQRREQEGGDSADMLNL